jgi:hypothetical protein
MRRREIQSARRKKSAAVAFLLQTARKVGQRCHARAAVDKSLTRLASRGWCRSAAQIGKTPLEEGGRFSHLSYIPLGLSNPHRARKTVPL